jgi:eukaryotic-like serine/threonine-protein kinase
MNETLDDGLEPGTVLDGKFRVEGVLGVGGMGAVYEITHQITHHRRAMKLLHPHVASHKVVVDRFLREASAAGRIGNPHIVETFDGGYLTTGEPYLVMEFLEGTTLADRIEAVAGKGLPTAEVVAIFEQLCDGVQAAHDAGIIHRDLKPENVFLSEGSDGATFVRVLDFGISKFDTPNATKLTGGGSTMGTPAYMSPEQFEDTGSVDHRTDVYALGVMAYETLTGVHPYPATSLTQLVTKLMQPREVAISVALGMPPELDGLLRSTMAKDPEERPDSPTAFFEALKRVTHVPAARGPMPMTRPRGGAAPDDGKASYATPESALNETVRIVEAEPNKSTVVQAQAPASSPASAPEIERTQKSAQAPPPEDTVEQTPVSPATPRPNRLPMIVAALVAGGLVYVALTMESGGRSVETSAPVASAVGEVAPAPTASVTTSAPPPVSADVLPSATPMPSPVGSSAPVAGPAPATSPAPKPVASPASPPPAPVPTTERAGKDDL